MQVWMASDLNGLFVGAVGGLGAAVALSWVTKSEQQRKYEAYLLLQDKIKKSIQESSGQKERDLVVKRHDTDINAVKRELQAFKEESAHELQALRKRWDRGTADYHAVKREGEVALAQMEELHTRRTAEWRLKLETKEGIIQKLSAQVAELKAQGEKSGLLLHSTKMALEKKETQLAELSEGMRQAQEKLVEERASMRRELDACMAELKGKKTGLHSEAMRRLARVQTTFSHILKGIRSPLMSSLEGELQAAMEEVQASEATAQHAVAAAQNRLFAHNGDMARMAATYAEALQRAQKR